MIIYAVIGTAPAHMGKCVVEANVKHILHSFVATRGDKPVMLDDLGVIMHKKVATNANIPSTISE